MHSSAIVFSGDTQKVRVFQNYPSSDCCSRLSGVLNRIYSVGVSGPIIVTDYRSWLGDSCEPKVNAGYLIPFLMSNSALVLLIKTETPFLCPAQPALLPLLGSGQCASLHRYSLMRFYRRTGGN